MDNNEPTLGSRALEERFASVNGDFSQMSIKGKDDALRLQSKVNDWREDVSTLASHIATQLQYCKSLRNSKAMTLIPMTGPTEEVNGEIDTFRLLRSDIRSLYEYRLSYLASFTDLSHIAGDSDFDKEVIEMKSILDEPSTVEKVGSDPTAAYDTLMRLVHAKSDLLSKIAEDFVKKKKQADLDKGIEEELSLVDESASTMLSRDTKLFLRLADSFQALCKESKSRYINTAQQNQPSRATLFAPSDTDNNKAGLRMDEANFAIQKLQREVNELKIQKAKLMSNNSQLEENYAHIQAQFELEKKTHQANVKWHEPRIQKLEDAIRTSAKALAELRLNVDLITNMYKKTCDDVMEYEKQKSVIVDERDVLAMKLYDEVKKMSTLNMELVRKDKLVMYAMGARHEVIKCWNETKEALAEMSKEKVDLGTALRSTKDTVRLLEAMLAETQETCRQHELKFNEKDRVIQTLRDNINEIHASNELVIMEKSKSYEEEYEKLLAKFDKTKKELVETVQDNIVLDGKLRAAHDRISRFLS